MAKWIIVVDDDTANLKMAGHILSKNNMRVTALKSGSAFLEYVTDNGLPDLVLLDIKMPVMDGFETLDRLRQLEEQQGLMKTPVIFLTADEDVDTQQSSIHQHTAIGFFEINKVFTMTECLSKISGF